MPDIVVLYNPDDATVAGCERGIRRLLDRCAWLRVENWSSGGLGVYAIGHRYGFPRRSQDGNGKHLFLSGDILQDDVDERASGLEEQRPVCEDPLFNALFNLWAQRGLDSLCGLNGRYSLICWDEKKRELSVATDPFGNRHLYYLQTDNRIAISTNLSVLTSLPQFSKSLDPQGAVESLCLGFQLEDRTLFDGIKVLPASSLLSYRQGKSEIRQGSRFDFSQERCQITWDEAVEELHRLLLESLRKRAPLSDSYIVPLSGGMDSRCMAGLARELGLQTSFFTYGTQGCDDITYASKVASAMGKRTTVLPNSYDYMVKWWADPFLFNGGCCAPNIGVFVDFLEKIGSDRGIFLSGYLADLLSGGRVIFHLDGDTIHTPERFFSIQEATALFKDSQWRRAAGNIPTVLKGIVDDTGHESQQRLLLAELFSRQRNYASFQERLTEVYGGLIVPFEDVKVYSFLLSLPPLSKEEHQLYKRFQIKAFPDLARVPCTTTGGTPLSPTMSSLLRAAFEKMFEKAGEHWRVKAFLSKFHKKSATVDHAAALRHNGAPLLHWILDSREMTSGILDPDEVAALVKRHLDGNNAETWKILAILHIMQGLQVCAGDVKPPVVHETVH